MKAGTMRIGIHVSVGDGSPIEVGNVAVPLELKFSGRELVVDLRDMTDVLRTTIETIFGDEGGS